MDWTSLLGGLGGGGASTGGGGFNWDALGSALGMIGSAISPKDSWQQGLGQAGTAINMSNIYGKAQEKATQEKNSYMDTLIKALGGLTPDGEKGPTSVTQNADGSFSMKGNVGSVPGEGGGSTRPTIPQSGGGGSYWGDPSRISPSVAGNIDNANPWGSFMKALSGFQGSSAGLTSADYAGLAPEMIDALAGRQAQGQDQSLRTIAFLSEMLGPKAGRVIEGPDSYMLVDETTGQVRDLGIPILRKPEVYDTVATENGLMYKTPYGLVPTGQMPHSGGIPQQDKLVKFDFHYPGAEGGMVNDTRIIPQGEWNNYSKMVQSQGGGVGHMAQPTPPRPGDITEREKALTEAEKKTGITSPETHANRYLPENAGFIYKPRKARDWLPDVKPELITLPKGWNKGMVQKYADAKKITDLYEAYQQMLIENSQLRGK